MARIIFTLKQKLMTNTQPLFTPQDMIDELSYINSQVRIDLDEWLSYSRKFKELSIEVDKIVDIKQKHYDELSQKLIERSNHYYHIKT